MTNLELEEFLEKIFDTRDQFADPKEGEYNLTVPELAKRMEKLRKDFRGARQRPHDFADDVR